MKKKEPQKPVINKKENIDTASMTVQCHIVIKDNDTGKILLNQRG
jgi:hypothetical protein